jgi:NAD-dependent DNA ligase
MIDQSENKEIMVRGELILSKEDWKHVKLSRSNPRNTVAGLANSKKPDVKIAKLVWFIAYECIEPEHMTSKQSMKWLSNKGFHVVDHHFWSKEKTNPDTLSKLLMDRRRDGDFEIDGIVVTHNDVHDSPENDNPKYAFAFKSVLTAEKAEVIVKEVIWNVSKNGLLKPVVVFDMIYLSGVHISRASGHNAQFIDKHKIGPGSKIVVIRSGDVIPYILDVLSSSASGDPQFPDPIQYPCEWNNNKVELVLKNPMAAHEYHLKQLENYAIVLSIKGLGPKVIKRLYDKGIDTVKKLVNVTKMDLYRATLSSKLTMKIYNQMQDIYNKGTCVEFMAASNVFGGGFGKKKFQLISEAFPEVLANNPPTLKDLLETKGIGERFARHFLEYLGKFHEFMSDVGLPCRSTLQPIENTPEGQMALYGKVIVFTGFRNKELEAYIVKRGGKVTTSVSSSTNIVVAKNLEDTSIKAEMAKELGIPIMSFKTFSEEIGFVDAPPLPFDKEEVDDEFAAMKAELEKEGLLEEDGEESDEDDEKGLNHTAECVRHSMNWANMKRTHIFGKSSFDESSVVADLPKSSPKLESLLKNIESLDNKDMAKHGKHFKHMIFSDVTKRGFGAKVIAAALQASGYHHAYDKEFVIDVNKLSKTKGMNFAVLASTQIYTKPITVDFKQKLLQTYNARPRNVHGSDIRIIVLDSGYKEGIDLFDVKYVHLYEPLLTYADEMQAIGRATRFCGQKGLHFDEKKGWKLHVYKYDHVLKESIAEELGGKTSYELILKEMNWNKNLSKLSMEMEKLCQLAAVDKLLTKSVHAYSHQQPVSGGTWKNHDELEKHITSKYGHLKWPQVFMENLCVSKKQSDDKPDILEFSPSQEFIRQYFTPSNPHKGMFLWHSLGSGKTCTAVAAASSSWEAEGYTILWVTRGTLRSDVYKNMFDMSCVERIRDLIKSGEKLPESMTSRKKLLSKSWLPPVSYRQFNNALQRQNRLYDFLIKRNGYSDPFKKTLLIIDEAHLMLSATMKEKEKPDVKLLKAWLRNSFKVSGENSARVMLMSATPITTDPFDFVKLLNLTDTKDLPEDPKTFTEAFLDEQTLSFTESGKTSFIEKLTGRLSYLNRTKDIRQFAQPTVHQVNVHISEPADLQIFLQEIEGYESTISQLKEIKLGDTKKKMIEEIEKTYEKPIADCDKLPKVVEKKSCVSQLKKEMKEEKGKVEDIAKQKVAEAKQQVAMSKDSIKESKKNMKIAKKNDASILTVLQKRCYKKSKEDVPSAKMNANANASAKSANVGSVQKN